VSEPAELSPRRGVSLETLGPLSREACDDPVRLTLSGQGRLRSIEGIQHLRGLVEFSVVGAPLLEDLTPLAGLTSLRRLEVRDCPRVGRLGPVLEKLRGLESLCLIDMGQLTIDDYLPVAHMRRLSYLVLWECAALPEHLRCMHNTAGAIAKVRAVLAALIAPGATGA
jgi:hypothetical protein